MWAHRLRSFEVAEFLHNTLTGPFSDPENPEAMWGALLRLLGASVLLVTTYVGAPTDKLSTSPPNLPKQCGHNFKVVCVKSSYR